NHDWDRHGPGGWDAVRREERFIAAAGGTGAALLPAGGCPGPAVVDVGKVVRLVALDTQWWLHNGTKPEDPTSSCPADSDREVIGGTSARYELLSGAGIFGHLDRVTALDGTRFAKRASGFMRVEFLGDGRARLSVIVVDRSGGGTEAFALWLE